jgi:hypothetical protein
MSKNNEIYQIITYKPAIKKRRPYLKQCVQKFSDAEKFKKAFANTLQKKHQKFTVNDFINNAKTVYSKSLGEINYQKKQYKL